jgi:hypothetical protein
MVAELRRSHRRRQVVWQLFRIHDRGLIIYAVENTVGRSSSASLITVCRDIEIQSMIHHPVHNLGSRSLFGIGEH